MVRWFRSVEWSRLVTLGRGHSCSSRSPPAMSRCWPWYPCRHFAPALAMGSARRRSYTSAKPPVNLNDRRRPNQPGTDLWAATTIAHRARTYSGSFLQWRWDSVRPGFSHFSGQQSCCFCIRDRPEALSAKPTLKEPMDCTTDASVWGSAQSEPSSWRLPARAILTGYTGCHSSSWPWR